jgi:hypothetical protein
VYHFEWKKKCLILFSDEINFQPKNPLATWATICGARTARKATGKECHYVSVNKRIDSANFTFKDNKKAGE